MSDTKRTYGGAMLTFIIAVFAIFAAVLIVPASRSVFEQLSNAQP